MGASNADNNSIHSSSITDFGPAAPLRESLNDVESDDFSDLEWKNKAHEVFEDYEKRKRKNIFLLNNCHKSNTNVMDWE